jgi:hypothetical protein
VRGREEEEGLRYFQAILDLLGSETSEACDGIRELVYGIRAEFWT